MARERPEHPLRPLRAPSEVRVALAFDDRLVEALLCAGRFKDAQQLADRAADEVYPRSQAFTAPFCRAPSCVRSLESARVPEL